MLLRSEAEGSGASLVVAHRAVGTSLFSLGQFNPARAQLKQALALYDPEEHRDLAYAYGFEPRVLGLDFIALALFPLGYPAQALGSSCEGLAAALKLGHAVTLAVMHQHARIMHHFFRSCRRPQA